MQLTNYLFFKTGCEQALDFYAKCDLGAVVVVIRHGQAGMPIRTEAMRGKIMHALFAGPGVRFFAPDNDDAEPMKGSAMMFELDDREQTRSLFTRLAAGGQVTTPLAVQPWGDFYGKLTDRFGVQWMFNCTSKS
jgi:PhnB protein